MPRLSSVSRAPLASAHRGFVYALHRAAAAPGEDDRFAFSIAHRGLTLHTSAATHRTAAAADRAARQFVDDALGAYDYAERALAA